MREISLLSTGLQKAFSSALDTKYFAPITSARYIFALRLLFVIIFEHFVFGVCKLIDFGVPDIPESLDIKVGNTMI